MPNRNLSALKYKIVVYKNVKGFEREIDEIAILELNAFINYGGIQFSKNIYHRLNDAINAEEINIDKETVEMIKKFMALKKKEDEIINKLKLEI